MAWNYTGNPASSPTDAVRFELGDTDPKRPLLQDEEIAYVLVRTGNSVMGAALQCCSNVMAKLARSVDETTGPVSRSFSQRFKNMSIIRADLEYRFAMQGGSAGYVGGISNTDMRSNEADADWARGSFKQKMMEHPKLDAADSGVYAPFNSLSDRD